MDLTKDFIEQKLLRSDGKINSRKVKNYDIEELYLVYHNISKPTCTKNHNLKFISFTKGYSTSCSNADCTKERGYKNRKQDYAKMHEKMKETKLKKYGNEHYVNVEKRKRTIKEIKDKNISRSKLHPKYNLEQLTKEYIEENFITKNKLNKDAFMSFYSCKENWMYVKLRDLEVSYTNDRSSKEKEISKFIKDAKINNRQIIKPLELDLYSEKHNFAIEYNGLMWHSFGISKYDVFNNSIIEEKNKNKHLLKTSRCEEKGIQLFHIFENEWIDKNKKKIWISIIYNKLNLNKEITFNECVFKKLKEDETNSFLENNDLEGSTEHNFSIGMFNKHELISVMAFNVFEDEYTLLRLCTKNNMNYNQANSKILNYFEKKYKPNSIKLYTNRRWSTGNFYEKAGFTFIENTIPSYFYFKTNENILWSKNKFQKHKLENFLEKYDSNLTETENMYENGYRKIYDAGNKVYIKKYKYL